MTVLPSFSLKKKLIVVVMAVTFFTVGLGFCIVILNDIKSFKEDMVNNKIMIARLIGWSCIPPLAFQDKTGVEEILTKLEFIPSLMNGYVYDEKGELFSAFEKIKADFDVSLIDERELSRFEKKYLHIRHPITYQNRKYGTIYLRSSTSQLDEKIRNYLIIMAALMVGLMFAAYLIASSLQKVISGPILRLADVTERISSRPDYSLRVKKQGEDEIGVLYDGFNNMLEQIHIREMEREKAKESLLESEALLKATFNATADGILVVDKAGKVSQMNDRFSEMWKIPQRILDTKDDDMLIVSVLDQLEDPNAFQAKIRELYLCSQESMDELNFKDGRVFERFSCPLVIEGKEAGRVWDFRDITDRKQAEEELRKYRDHLKDQVAERTRELEAKASELEAANLRLQEADRLKSVFLASMSHELRTPLNSIIGFTGIILQGMCGEINDEQNKQLTMVKNSADHLLNLINDLLDIAKIEAGRVEPSIEAFALDDVVNEVIESFSPAVREKGLELIGNVPEGITLISDKRRIKQVLMNFASNAVKFTDQGSIRVAVQILGAEKVKISVIDTGIGIKEEDMDILFQPFQQVDTSLTRKHKGTGLGLHLTKKLAALLGGDVSAKSEFGKGSAFTLTVPMKPDVS